MVSSKEKYVHKITQKIEVFKCKICELQTWQKKWKIEYKVVEVEEKTS